jgi:hypothetical protein
MVGTAPTLDTSEKRYTVFDPVVSAATKKEESGGLRINPYNRPIKTSLGGIAYDPETGFDISRSTMFNPRYDPIPTPFNYMTGGIYAQGGMVPNERTGSSNNFSYDPVTGTYKKLAQGGLTSLKAGGLREGAFIVPADVISHLGNGSSEAGMKIVRERLKGRPIKGPGDGMSDSIPTTIAGKQPARVANEEAEIPPEVVAALGGGSLEKGAKKLYEMMDKIRKDRTGKKKQAPAVKADKYMPA